MLKKIMNLVDLPTDIFCLIVKHCYLISFINLGLCCKQLANLLNHDKVWAHKIISDCEPEYHQKPPMKTWKDWYRYVVFDSVISFEYYYTGDHVLVGKGIKKMFSDWDNIYLLDIYQNLWQWNGKLTKIRTRVKDFTANYQMFVNLNDELYDIATSELVSLNVKSVTSVSNVVIYITNNNDLYYYRLNKGSIHVCSNVKSAQIYRDDIEKDEETGFIETYHLCYITQTNELHYQMFSESQTKSIKVADNVLNCGFINYEIYYVTSNQTLIRDGNVIFNGVISRITTDPSLNGDTLSILDNYGGLWVLTDHDKFEFEESGVLDIANTALILCLTKRLMSAI